MLSRLPPEFAFLADSIFNLLDLSIDGANGGGALVSSEADAFFYAVVEVFEDGGGVPGLRVTVRGDSDYLSGDNDPAKVVDVFSFEMP